MGLNRTTEPAATLTAAELKTHCRITTTTEDTYLAVLIASATAYCESYTERSFLTQTWTYTLPRFSHLIKLKKPPLQSVTSVKYTDRDGVSHTLVSGTDYEIDTTGVYGSIRLETLPDCEKYNPAAVEIIYKAGSTTAPAQAKLAIMQLAGYWYENREALGQIPEGVNELLDQVRVWEI